MSSLAKGVTTMRGGKRLRHGRSGRRGQREERLFVKNAKRRGCGSKPRREPEGKRKRKKPGCELATLPQKTRESLLKGLSKRTTPLNIFPLLFTAQHAMEKLNAVIDTWADTSREMVLSARKLIDDVLCVRAEECFEMGEWVKILESDGGRFEDGEKVGGLWIVLGGG